MKKTTKTLAACGLLAVGAVGAYAAFYGTSNTTENAYSIVAGTAGATGDDVAEVIEGNWPQEGDTDEDGNPLYPDGLPQDSVEPNEIIPKNPVFQVNTEYDAYVFARIDIPVVEATLDLDGDSVAAEDGSEEGTFVTFLMGAGDTRATWQEGIGYSYVYDEDTDTGEYVQNGWVLEYPTSSEDTGSGYGTYDPDTDYSQYDESDDEDVYWKYGYDSGNGVITYLIAYKADEDETQLDEDGTHTNAYTNTSGEETEASKSGSVTSETFQSIREQDFLVISEAASGSVDATAILVQAANYTYEEALEFARAFVYDGEITASNADDPGTGESETEESE